MFQLNTTSPGPHVATYVCLTLSVVGLAITMIFYAKYWRYQIVYFYVYIPLIYDCQISYLFICVFFDNDLLNDNKEVIPVIVIILVITIYVEEAVVRLHKAMDKSTRR